MQKRISRPANINLPDLEPAQDIYELKEQLSDQLTEGEWKLVFNQLKPLLSDQKKQTLRGVIGRYNRINEEYLAGTISSKLRNIRFNKLRADFLSFIHDLERKDLKSDELD